ncbi:MAG: transglutaminase domain-containing protein [Phycisphaerae bacterium]|nr:transglutaminase domain-containing protein [Phycisphaerae bacterium]
MTRQRVIAFLLMTTICGTVSYMTGRVVFSAVMWAVSLVGLSGLVTVDVSRSTRLVAMLATTLAFVIVSRVAPEDPKEAYPLSAVALTYVVAWYFMVLMAGAFFVRRRGPMPRTFPLYAIIALICSGNIFVEPQQDRVYMLVAMAVAVMTAFYFAAERRYPAGLRAAESLVPRGMSFLVLLIAMVGAGGVSAMVYARQYEINRAVSSLAARLYSGRSMGFSDNAMLRSMTYLKTRGAAELALRVFSRRAPGYLRGRAFVRPLRRRWYAARGKAALRPSGRRFEGIPAPAGGRNLFALGDGGLPRWEAFEVYPVRLWAKALFCPHGTTVISAPADELEIDECGAVISPSPLVGVSYTAYVPARGKAHNVSQEARESCVSVPAELDERVGALADSLFKDCRTTAEKITAVEKYFTSNYEYKLGIQIPPGADPVTYFLLERPAAHCEYFAAGAALLLRLGGVPAYYATGFVVSERSGYGGYWIARNADAHAWVEACDDNGRWVTVEATPAAGIPSSLRRSDGYYLWDSLRFGLGRFMAMLRQEGAAGLGRWWLRRLGDLVRAMFTTVGGLIVSVCLAGLGGWLVLRRLRWFRRRHVDPAVDRLHRLLGRMDRRVRKIALVRGRGETLAHFARRIEGQASARLPAGAAARWYQAYAAVRYGARAGPEDLAELQRQMPPGAQRRRAVRSNPGRPT